VQAQIRKYKVDKLRRKCQVAATLRVRSLLHKHGKEHVCTSGDQRSYKY